METLLKKDRIKEVNPYLFQKIQSKINKENTNLIPLWSISVLRYCLIGLVLIMGYNIISTFNSNKNAETNNISQNASYNKFVEDNHFDALSSLYPTEFLPQK